MPEDPAEAVRDGSEHAGSVERERAGRIYRRAVRTTGVTVVFGIAAVFVVDAFLPGTSAADRQGLLVTAALVVVTGTIWFSFVPQRWFGSARTFVAATISELVLLTMVVLTGGAQSIYVGYLVVPAVVLILSGSVRQILVLGGLTFAGIALIAVSSTLAGNPPGEGAAPRLLLLAMVIATCAAVARATGRHRDVTTERAAGLADEGVAVLSMAMTDALTNLPNRRALEDHLTRFIADAARTGLPFSVIALDLDGMKRVNDEFGHNAGDDLLRNFGRAIKGAIRGTDVGLRIGGDEFLILLPRTSEVPAKRVAERLAETAILFPGQSGPARFSYGIATHRAGESGDEVLGRADAVLGSAKRDRAVSARPVEPRA
ncbi:MAG TPA: GGDEF domain-containing protein [Candidatus Limnocylindria bacterium]